MISNQIERHNLAEIEREVLAINDTSSINLQSHLGRLKPAGLGYINGGNHKRVGFFIHPTLIAEAETGYIRGLSSLQIWTRPEVTRERKKIYKQLEIEEKESYKWIKAAEQTKRAMPNARRITMIGDREADCYEEFVRVADERTELVIRRCQNRRLAEGTKLYERLSAESVIGEYEIEVEADKRIGRKTRTARIQVRVAEVQIKAPPGYHGETQSKQLQAIEAREIDAPAGVEPILWRLLTTHEVKTYADAQRIIGYYQVRWEIEQLFRILKRQGLDIEASQMESIQSIQKVSVLALEIAVKTLQLTGSRKGGKQEIRQVFSETEREILERLNKELEGKTKKQKNPHQKQEVGYGAWVIARLGGWKSYQSQRPPGVITIKRGLQRFETIQYGYSLTCV